jgi:hypothetical protein
MADTSKALNVIGKPYNIDANLLAYAFEYAHRTVGNKAENIIDYVKTNQHDRRYTVKFRACDTSMSSAIVEYRHKRYYIYGIYNHISHDRTFYVELAYR